MAVTCFPELALYRTIYREPEFKPYIHSGSLKFSCFLVCGRTMYQQVQGAVQELTMHVFGCNIGQKIKIVLHT